MSVQMQFLLRGILAWDLTERESALGLVYLCFGVAMLIATPLGGAAADNFPRRTVMLASQAIIAATALGMGIAVVTDVVQFWMVLVAGIAQGISFGFYGPARLAFAADLVENDQLGNAIALSLLSMSATRVFAPALAGVLAGFAFVGVGGAYLFSAAMSICCLVAIRRLPHIPVAGTSKRGAFTDIAEGLRYVRAKPRLRRLVVTSFVVIMFGFNYVAFSPALVKDVFGRGDSALGLLISASAVGAVLVSVPLASRADGPRAQAVMGIGGLAFGASVMLLAIAPTFATAAMVVVLVGGAATVYQTLSNTIALQLADGSHRGRIQSLMQLSFAGFGMAAAPLGVLAEKVGLRSAIGLMGLVAFSASLSYILSERWAERAATPRPMGPTRDQTIGNAPNAGAT